MHAWHRHAGGRADGTHTLLHSRSGRAAAGGVDCSQDQGVVCWQILGRTIAFNAGRAKESIGVRLVCLRRSGSWPGSWSGGMPWLEKGRTAVLRGPSPGTRLTMRALPGCARMCLTPGRSHVSCASSLSHLTRKSRPRRIATLHALTDSADAGSGVVGCAFLLLLHWLLLFPSAATTRPFLLFWSCPGCPPLLVLGTQPRSLRRHGYLRFFYFDASPGHTASSSLLRSDRLEIFISLNGQTLNEQQNHP